MQGGAPGLVAFELASCSNNIRGSTSIVKCESAYSMSVSHKYLIPSGLALKNAHSLTRMRPSLRIVWSFVYPWT